jgi:MFS family permease
VPESPRWMFIHGRDEEAEALVSDIERTVHEQTGQELEEPRRTITVRQRRAIGFATVTKTVFKLYPKRTALGLALFAGQAFLYNAVFFTYALVLDTFYGIGANQVGWYIAAFAVGNFAGPLVLGRFFDSVGRRPMIAGTYILSGILLAIMAVLFNSGTLTATSQTAALAVIFFFASAGASSAYLTVSEVFPMETRAMAISFFYAVGTAIGGITGPLLFGRLIETGMETNVMYGYLLGAALMAAAGIVEIVLGVEAAGRQLEDIAKPLTAEDAEAREEGEGELELDKLQGEDAAPIERRFERDRTPGRTGSEP